MKSSAQDTDPVAVARGHLDQGRLLEGRAVLDALLGEEPGHAAARCLAGYASLLGSDAAAALEHLEIATASDPLLFEAHYLRGFLFADLNRADDARRALLRALALDPACESARGRLIEVLIALDRIGEAARHLELAVEHGMADELVAALRERLAPPQPEASPVVAGPTADAPEAEWMPARHLLHPRRLDVVAKALYARALLGERPAHSGYDAESVYLRHILFRTGGAEPGDETRKGSLAAFAVQFAALVASMRERGFDPAEPIPVARRTGLILNGSHRLAAALALGIRRVPVVFRDDVDGLAWDAGWFADNAFAPREVDELLQGWLGFQGDRAGCVILWSPAESRWGAIEEEIARDFPVVARRDFEFDRASFREAVRDVYAADWGPVAGGNIERKIAFFEDFAPRLRLLVVHAPAGVRRLDRMKDAVRERHADLVPADRFATLHTTAAPHETRHVAGLFLHAETLEALRRRPASGVRAEFLEWLRRYAAAIAKLGIDPETCCVVGSSTLEVLGVRDSTDVDFTVTGEVRERLFTAGVTRLENDLDVVSRNYPRAIARPAAPTDDDLISDRAMHFRFRGLKFAALDVVVERKQIQRRPKDLADVALVGRRRLEGRL